MTGRAWPSNGEGGTLNLDGSGPGPYYVLAKTNLPFVGSLGVGSDPPLTRRAVHLAVKAIQRALNRDLPAGLRVDGRFGPGTKDATVKFQRKHSLGADGAVGRITAQVLFTPTIERLATSNVPACLIAGLIQNESGFDPGAVGYVDDQDLGLVQINGRAHPDLTETERFQPIVAVDFAVGYYESALRQLDGNLVDAVVSYNLGVGGWSSYYQRLVGAKGWIADGRPNTWTPPGQTESRDVAGYASRILSGCT